MVKPAPAIPGSLAGKRERDLHISAGRSGQGCSEDGTRVPDDWLFAVGKTLSGRYAERKTQLDTARRGFILGLIGEDNMALAVNSFTELRADPLRVDLSLWPSRDKLTETQRQVRAAQGALRGAW